MRPAGGHLVMVHDYPPLSGGGLALGVLDLARCLRPEVDARIVSSRLVDHFADDRRPGAADAAPGAPRWARARSWTALRWMAAADVLLVHWTFSFRSLSTATLLLGPCLRRRTVCVIHTAPEHCRYNRIGRLPAAARRVLMTLLRVMLRGCVEVVALSTSHAQALADAGIPASRVLPLPVAAPAMPSARDGCSPRVVGYVGELSGVKGADALPAIVAALTPRFSFRIAGAGPLDDAIRRRVAALPPEQRRSVELVGHVRPHAMPALYAGLGYVLILSHTESQCRVAFEAMLAGVIVVARPCGGIVDVIEDGVTGCLVGSSAPAAIGAAMDRLDRDPQFAARIRAAARTFALRALDESRAGWRSLVGELRPLPPD